jgi:hypothetical protein
MTSFDGREKAAENKYTHDAELDFKINARAHKLLGLWAGKNMNLDDLAAKDYAMQIVQVDFEVPTEDDVIHKIFSDFANAGIIIDKDEIGEELVRCQDIAREQVYKM